jgi:hypothetical protein
LCKATAPHVANFSSGLPFWVDAGRTSDRLQRHNLQNSGPCALCDQLQETIQHLIVGCVYAREVWFSLLRQSGREQLVPSVDSSLVEMVACLSKGDWQI